MIKTTTFAAVLGIAIGAASPALAETTNGTSFNGIRVNGSELNGLSRNGLSRNGLGRNGIRVNGIRVNGRGLNGWRTNGAFSGVSPCQDGEIENHALRVIGIEFPN